jgi:hypothetical protein
MDYRGHDRRTRAYIAGPIGFDRNFGAFAGLSAATGWAKAPRSRLLLAARQHGRAWWNW